MENLPRNLEKIVNNLAPTNLTKEVGRWSILFVDNHGKIISVKWLKGLSIAAIFLLIVSIISSVSFFFLYAGHSAKNKKLQASLDASRQQVKDLQYEMDLRKAEQVVAEERKQKEHPRPEMTEDLSEEVPKESRPAEVSVSDLEAGSAPAITSSGKNAGVRDFSVTHEINNKMLKVKFVIENKSESIETIAGRIFVILKHDKARQNSWLTMPSVTLISGKPSNPYRGQYFKISRFKSVIFKIENETRTDFFKTASLFVYSTKGELILEEDIPVEVKSVVALPEPQTGTAMNEEAREDSSEESISNPPVSPGREESTASEEPSEETPAGG